MTIRNCYSGDLLTPCYEILFRRDLSLPSFHGQVTLPQEVEVKKEYRGDDLSLIAEIIDALAYTMLEKS
jgi:hypothetical protein